MPLSSSAVSVHVHVVLRQVPRRKCTFAECSLFSGMFTGALILERRREDDGSRRSGNEGVEHEVEVKLVEIFNKEALFHFWLLLVKYGCLDELGSSPRSSPCCATNRSK
eukprot:7932367-Pyramimonas_sp.AAC.1